MNERTRVLAKYLVDHAGSHKVFGTRRHDMSVSDNEAKLCAEDV